MVGNNNSVMRENDKGKRLYAQLELMPVDRLTVTLGGDYASEEGGSIVTANAFAGYGTERFRVGGEVFLSPERPAAQIDDLDRSGFSLFAAARVHSTVELLARYDQFMTSAGDLDSTADYGVLGAAFAVEEAIRIIPNLVIDRSLGADDPMVTGRLTLEANF